MRTSKSKGGRKPNTLGWILSIGGMLLAAISYFLLGIDQFFLDLNGVLGLSDIMWAIIGGVIWIFFIMALLTPIMLKFGTKTISND